MQTCIYCRQPCAPELFAAEPLWRCAWCAASAHLRCYRQLHCPPGGAGVPGPDNPSIPTEEGCQAHDGKCDAWAQPLDGHLANNQQSHVRHRWGGCAWLSTL